MSARVGREVGSRMFVNVHTWNRQETDVVHFVFVRMGVCESRIGVDKFRWMTCNLFCKERKRGRERKNDER